jgi:uncharacterized protein DUF3943
MMKKLFPVSLYIILLTPLLVVCTRIARADTIFGDTSPVLMSPVNSSVLIDSAEYRKADIKFYKEAERKSLADFEDFLRDTRNVYFTLWLVRIVQVNIMDVSNKEKQMLINPFRWWKNILGFQNKNRKRGDFEVQDGDSFKTNWIAHPVFGAYSYLYYRAKGYNFYTSALGSVVQSTLFEYTIEGVIQSPSIQDLIVTPGIGIPAGVVLEETSEWLESQDSGFLKAASYIVNPVKIIVPDRDKVNLGPLVTGQVVIAFDW